MPEHSIAYHRIVSLTPSLTEILFALGLGDSVAAVTDACDYPPEALQKPHVHAWFDPDMDRIRDLGPDLILGLESAHAQLKTRFAKKREGVPFVLTHPSSVDQALGDIAFLGNLLGVPERAQRLLSVLQERLARVDDRVRRISPDRRPTVSRVLEWMEDQLIVAGPLSFQYDVITRAGGRNVTGMLQGAYPKISLSQFQVWDPEMVFFLRRGRPVYFPPSGTSPVDGLPVRPGGSRARVRLRSHLPDRPPDCGHGRASSPYALRGSPRIGNPPDAAGRFVLNETWIREGSVSADPTVVPFFCQPTVPTLNTY